MSMNPYKFSTPPGWNNILSAPRDGTVIEIQNNYGIAPTYGLHHFVKDEWWSATDDFMFVGKGPWLSWRPYVGDIKDYVDPTNGRQNTREYWLDAAANAFGETPQHLANQISMLEDVTEHCKKETTDQRTDRIAKRAAFCFFLVGVLLAGVAYDFHLNGIATAFSVIAVLFLLIISNW